MNDGRPDPDELLKKVQREERDRTHGRLKIFLGYSAGVGKTYTMLEEAHLRLKQGLDVVVGCVESHGREETERLLEGLKVIPQRRVEYRGMMLLEPDVDAVLAMKPDLVLVDELAHTNAPGSRHAKRYQDVEELIAAGVDVYTTLNIQHLESMNDRVAQITKVKVQETIPDSVLDEADEIKIVDLPAEELIQRFKEGKVYIPPQAAVAIENFFNEGNLIALREMTLRRAAEHIDGQMLEYMQSRSIQGPWPAGETLLVCIGNSTELNERLIRNARRLADELNAEWHALYVETPAHNRLSRKQQSQAMLGLEMAAKMGARTSSSFGISIAEEVVRYARKHNVTRIIVGKPIRSRWKDLIFGSLANRIVLLGSPMDILIISYPPKEERQPVESESPPVRQVLGNKYFYSTWMVLAISFLVFFLRSYLAPTNLVMLYLIGVVVAAITWGLWSAIFTAALSVLAFDLILIPPYLSFRVTDTQYAVTFVAFLVVGVVVSFLVARSRDNAAAAKRREEYTSTLLALSTHLASVNDIRVACEIVSGHIMNAFQGRSVFLLPQGSYLALVHSSENIELDEKEMTAAYWTYRNGISSGKDTDTLSTASLKYYPLRTPNGVVGVMGVGVQEQERVRRLERERLLSAFANQSALAIERILFWRQISQVCKVIKPLNVAK